MSLEKAQELIAEHRRLYGKGYAEIVDLLEAIAPDYYAMKDYVIRKDEVKFEWLESVLTTYRCAFCGRTSNKPETIEHRAKPLKKRCPFAEDE